MKTKQIQFYGILAVISLLVSSCWFIGPSLRGNGNVTEEVRQVKGFDQIKVSRGMNVYITQGSPTKVVVVADNNLHEAIETEVENGILKVFVNENIRWAKEKKVMVTIAALSRIEASSGSNVYSQNRFMTENLELSSSSGANLTIDLNTKHLKANCSSGANIFLSGLAMNAELEGSSGANLKGQELKVDNCTMRASSGGNVYATVSGQLEANASSGGNIIYYGQPTSTETNCSSGGNINRK
jgi:hypothetical protein